MDQAYLTFVLYPISGEAPAIEGARAALQSSRVDVREFWNGSLRVERLLRDSSDGDLWELFDEASFHVKDNRQRGITAAYMRGAACSTDAMLVGYRGPRTTGDVHLAGVIHAVLSIGRGFVGGCLARRLNDDAFYTIEALGRDLGGDARAARDFLDVHPWFDATGAINELHTHGMASFGLSEVVIFVEEDDDPDEASSVLVRAAEAWIAMASHRPPATLVLHGGPRVSFTEDQHVECLPNLPFVKVAVTSE